jgi:nitrite reductase/ring-hydroxylating ferredoxin subunit
MALKTTYGAYLRKAAEAEDFELTHVGRGTPCGEYLRRFWQPVALSSDLKDLPVRIRILGEDLVVFRDLSGRVGLLELHCCHRQASLEFGKVCERGIICAYHGWQFDVDGKILDTPGEPARSTIKDKVCQGAYPVREYKGIVFGYMGPPDQLPVFPIYDVMEKPGATLLPGKIHSPCNWLQIRENETDPMHVAFLHTRLFGVQFGAVKGAIPTLEFIETPVGTLYITTRRWNDGKVYIRSNDMILPNIARVAGMEDGEGDEETLFDRRGGGLNWVVPIDDTNSWTIGWNEQESVVGRPGLNGYLDRMYRKGLRPATPFDVGQTGDAPYEQRQRQPGDWDVWVSQGPITKHGNENLAYTDRGVTLYRKKVREGIRAVRDGRDPKGLVREPRQIRSYSHNSVAFIPEDPDPERDITHRMEYARNLTQRILHGEIRPYVEHALECEPA